MQEAKAQGQSALKGLQTAYEQAWCHYLAEVSRWQSLQTVSRSTDTQLREAETVASGAEELYRQARNRLAEYMLDHRSHPGLAVHELQHAVSHYRDTRSACFDCA
jgi:hypothetical protein